MTKKIKKVELKPIEIKAEVLSLVSKFEKRDIKTPEQMTEATIALSELNKILDRITEEKEKITKPMNVALKEIRGRYKPAEDELAMSINSLRAMISRYQTEKRNTELAEEAKIAARIAPGKGNLSIETANKKMNEIEKVDQKIISDAGMVKFRRVKKFEVMDVTLLPAKFIMANEAEIRKAMNAGVEVDGVRYYEEEEVRNYR